MIDKQLLTQTVEQAIENTDLFIVDIKVNPGNAIVVELDSETGIDIDMCVNITRKIESVFDRDVEDYELEVGSAGLTAPFKVRGQYLKNIGNDIEVIEVSRNAPSEISSTPSGITIAPDNTLQRAKASTAIFKTDSGKTKLTNVLLSLSAFLGISSLAPRLCRDAQPDGI